MRFMKSLVNKLAENSENHKYLELLPYTTSPLERRSIYSYENTHGSSCKVFRKQLTSVESFCSRLESEQVSQEDYNYAKELWKKLNI